MGTEWEALQTYQALAAAQKQEEEERLRQQKQRDIKKALDEQIKDRHERREKEKNYDADYIRHMNRDVEKFKEENAANHAKQMQQYAQTRKIWEDQVSVGPVWGW